MAALPCATAHDEDQSWIEYVTKELDNPNSRDSVPCPSIFMASSPLRGLKPEAFIPQVVSIGLYHCDVGPHHSNFPNNKETERYKAIAANEMEKHKIMALKKAAKTFRHGCALPDEISKDIVKVRDQYDTEVHCKHDKKLACMLALDATFVVEVLRTQVNLPDRSGFKAYYCSRIPRPLQNSILRDFVLLENQVPLFLLLKIIRMDQGCETDIDAQKSLASMVERLAEVLPFHVSRDSVSSVKNDIGNRKHLLDCLYGMVTHGGQPARGTQRVTHFPRAENLANSGVTFRPLRRANTISIKYDAKNHVLHLPKIRVDDDTENLFRNLIAYESHLVEHEHVLSYLQFMNSLVDTPEDVAVLVEKDIIAQEMGSNDEVAKMWNNLCVNTKRVFSVEHEDVASRLYHHSQQRMNKWNAAFKQTYLSQPWLAAGGVSAVALLVMTFVILYYTILLYQKHEG